MKVLSKDDLVLLLNNYNQNTWSENEIEYLFNYYGDDWYIEGNKFEKAVENQKMKELRDVISTYETP